MAAPEPSNHGIVYRTVANAAALAAEPITAHALAQRAIWLQSDTRQLWLPKSTTPGDFEAIGGSVNWFGVPITSRQIINALDGLYAEDDAVGLQTSLSVFEPARVTCHARATANFNLASPPNHTFDGYTLAKYDVVWLPSQTTSSENGFYIYTGAAGAAGFSKLSSLDALIAANGVNVFVIKGTTYASKFFRWKTGSAPYALRDGAPLQASVHLESFYVAGDGDDFSPAMQRANDAVSDCGDILLGRTRYHFQTTVNVTRAWNLIGAGFGSTQIAGDQTVFNFVGTNTDDNPMLAAPGGNRLCNLWLKCNSHLSTDNVDMHAIFANRALYLERCFFSGWPGDAVHVQAYAITGDPSRGGAKGNANCCTYYNCIANDIGRNGYYFEGTDANAGSIIQCQAQHCGKRNVALDKVYTGTKDLTTLTLPGDVTGKTLVLNVNGGPTRTVTFTAASTTPANLVGEINTAMAADTAFTASLDGSNHLVMTVTPPAGGPFALLTIGASSTSLVTIGVASGIFDGDTHAWGFFDNSFLGNTYLACQTTTNVSVFGGAYRMGSNVQQSIAIGCYSESENNYVEFPSFQVGGNISFQVCPRASVIVPGLNTSGGQGSMSQTATRFRTNGTNVVEVVVCPAGTDTIWKATRTGDTTNGLSLQYGVASLVEWAFCMANSASVLPITITATGNAVGAGMPIMRRGIYLGGYLMQALAAASLPGTNGVHGTLGSAFYQNFAQIWHNPDFAPGAKAWSYLSAGGNTDSAGLTWKAGGYIPFDAVSATPNFGTINAGVGGSATVTVTGAATGDRVHVQMDSDWSVDSLILKSARVSAANTVKIYVFNAGAGTYNGGGTQTEPVKIQVSKMQ